MMQQIMHHFCVKSLPKSNLHEEAERVMQPRMTCRRYAACSQRWLCRQVVLGYVWLFSSHVSAS